MIKTFHKRDIEPCSSQWETAGLMGTFLVVLVGLPGHSESLTGRARHLVQHAVQLTLVFFGLSTPVVQKQIPLRAVPATPVVQKQTPIQADLADLRRQLLAPVQANPASASADTELLVLRTITAQPQMAYLFEGQASYHDKPCPNARVLIHLNSGKRSVTNEAVTGADGSYSLQVAIDVSEHDFIDWKIEAFTPDFEKVEIAGRRRIVDRQDEPDLTPVVVTRPVEFVVALSK